jgi:hypothetical protein
MRQALIAAVSWLALAGGAVASCPQGSAYPDGCAALVAAGQEGAFKFANYAAYQAAAALSGQTWTAPREPWNVACTDYGCGVYTDPSVMKVPGVDPLPAGCAIAPQPGPGGGKKLLCANYAGSISLVGWNLHPMTGPYANQCVAVVMNGNAVTAPGASLTIQDDAFQQDTQCTAAGTSGQLLTIYSPAPGGMTVASSTFDGNCSSIANRVQSSLIVDDRPNNSPVGVWWHNIFKGACARPGNVVYNSVDMEYNLFENWCILCSNVAFGCPQFGNGFHGEVYEMFIGPGAIGAPIDVPMYKFDYNVVMAPKTYYSAFTGAVFTAGFSGQIDDFEAIGNSFVTNVSVSGGATNFASIIELGVSYYGLATIKQNYFDPTGVVPADNAGNKACIVLGAASRNLPGSITGTTLTITGAWTITDGLITPGAIVYGGVGQAAHPAVMAYGSGGTSGVGGPGTYQLTASATSTGPYTETAVVGAWDLGAGGIPTAGGTQNVNLLTGAAVSGYTVVGGAGAQVC